jgi:hypothetical protein
MHAQIIKSMDELSIMVSASRPYFIHWLIILPLNNVIGTLQWRYVPASRAAENRSDWFKLPSRI